MTLGTGPGGSLEVLVVDDDVRVARVNAAYVGKVAGFRVAGQAHTAAEALAFLEDAQDAQDAHVDLVLLDHYLPDETGLSLVRRLRQLGHHTDIIMVTAARDIATVQAAMRHGALQYLVKPFTFAGLRAKLEGYAALRRALEGDGEAGQDQVDRIFGALGGASAGPAELPKGHSALTADLVREVLRGAEGPLSAQEVAERSSLSRQTAQRYLKLLERTGRVRLSLKYGETGRPEHRYDWV
ncbi:response regulator [Streptomyces rapamycinicus]|uniref:Transcriptional regulatory protein n=2 Tax=Streptomyces rapamycinicus TaxID=1226757 RepID=A0A0A0NC55_STRRN|nr:response regulator [Streptomyces rapamycinicus]AGP54554.1 chemotaxis protein CheY [Streptomyces rapamycinicus NRRL 5491]MBB4782063.1 response regulator of citrate/malate metabolism [Streptomyces rapamycinicus]RLV73293.1 chemotaxis protein CheY [Streptomyces rapamycinicus NRRL 5491]UTO62608.1 response regulator [Streptomyces rapamycinicus]UTP30563.1 response regulator [Streptomyces rapamycinicus NRRL 5491]